MATINGTNGDDTLPGTSGDDTINGLGGNDTIDGGDGGDTIYGGDGNDVITGGNGRDYIDGGNGDDIIHAGPSSNFVFPEFIYDGAGNDTVYGEEDQDLFFGSLGDDYYDGGTGGVQFEGDQIDYSAALAGVVVDLRLSSGQARSADAEDAAQIGVDTLVNIEGIMGTAFNDSMTGSDTYVSFNGGAGNDILVAGAAGASLAGDEGNDALTGGAENDLLSGGSGDDSMDGGAGFDTVSYSDASGGVTVSWLNPARRIPAEAERTSYSISKRSEAAVSPIFSSATTRTIRLPAVGATTCSSEAPATIGSRIMEVARSFTGAAPETTRLPAS